MEPLKSDGVKVLRMDVTEQASMAAGVQAVLDAEGRIDVLVNNAGYGYFGAVEKLPVQTAALFSYIDPVTAVLLSALFLHEPMTPAGIAGAVLILGALMLA